MVEPPAAAPRCHSRSLNKPQHPGSAPAGRLQLQHHGEQHWATQHSMLGCKPGRRCMLSHACVCRSDATAASPSAADLAERMASHSGASTTAATAAPLVTSSSAKVAAAGAASSSTKAAVVDGVSSRIKATAGSQGRPPPVVVLSCPSGKPRRTALLLTALAQVCVGHVAFSSGWHSRRGVAGMGAMREVTTLTRPLLFCSGFTCSSLSVHCNTPSCLLVATCRLLRRPPPAAPWELPGRCRSYCWPRRWSWRRCCTSRRSSWREAAGP